MCFQLLPFARICFHLLSLVFHCLIDSSLAIIVPVAQGSVGTPSDLLSHGLVHTVSSLAVDARFDWNALRLAMEDGTPGRRYRAEILCAEGPHTVLVVLSVLALMMCPAACFV